MAALFNSLLIWLRCRVCQRKTSFRSVVPMQLHFEVEESFRRAEFAAGEPDEFLFNNF